MRSCRDLRPYQDFNETRRSINNPKATQASEEGSGTGVPATSNMNVLGETVNALPGGYDAFTAPPTVL